MRPIISANRGTLDEIDVTIKQFHGNYIFLLVDKIIVPIDVKNLYHVCIEE